MVEVPKGKFNAIVDQMKFVELEFHQGSKALWGPSKFYGAELGDNSVLVLQQWNNDFCTSSFRIPNASIVSCNGKYAVLINGMDMEVQNKEVVLEENTYESETGEASLDERFAAIEGSNSNEGPALSKSFYDDDVTSNAETVLEAAKENVQVSIPTGERPVMAKGRAKPEETQKAPAPQKIVKTPKPEYVKPVQGPRNHEEPKPTKPKFDFGDW